jgi:hypothetical protein
MLDVLLMYNSYTDASWTLGPISNFAAVFALTSSSVAPGINSFKVIFPALRSISNTACDRTVISSGQIRAQGLLTNSVMIMLTQRDPVKGKEH